MIVLGIESSCDETAIAVIERSTENNTVLCEKIKSQIPIHKKYGGIVPELASRNHFEVISELLYEALDSANITINDVGLIALTQGPGLIGSLLIGLSFAKSLSYTHRIPLVLVDHIEAHNESPFITHQNRIEYPLVSLVVSGGHTSLFYYHTKFEYQVVAKTRDDAVGELMDKFAKFFDLGYPGGPLVDKLYKEGDPARFKFSIPKMSDGSNDFSFSGYKTAAMNYAKKDRIEKNTQDFLDLSASLLKSSIEYLLKKTSEVVENFKVKNVTVAGGVSRNMLLRDLFSKHFEEKEIALFMPEPQYCTDNGSMVAWHGYEKFRQFPEENYFDYRSNAYSRALFRVKSKSQKFR